MATSKSIFELVTDALETSLRAVTRLDGFTNTLEVHRESKLGTDPAPIDPNNRYTIIAPAEPHIVKHDGSDPRKPECMNADDYDQNFYLDNYGFDSEDGDAPHDAVGQSIAADVIKQVNADFETWVHPDNGGRLVLYPTIRFATPLDLRQNVFRGTVLYLELFVRTQKFEPHALPTHG